jgi:hypothetical protein
MEQQSPDAPLFELQVDYDSGNRFKESSKWGRFIAIVIFICLGLFLLLLTFGSAALIQGMATTSPDIASNGGLVIGGLFIIAAVYVFIAIQLFRFASLVKEGIERQDQLTFNNALKSLRNYFMASGIVSLILIVWSVYDTIKAFIYNI